MSQPEHKAAGGVSSERTLTDFIASPFVFLSVRSELDNLMSSGDFLSDNHFRPVAYITMNLLPSKLLLLQVEIRSHIWTHLQHLTLPLCILLWPLSRSLQAMIWRTHVALNFPNLPYCSTVECPKFQQYFRLANNQRYCGYNCIPWH